MPDRDIYLRIEPILDYSPVDPETKVAPPKQYRRDCMRNPGHEDTTIPLAEVEARRLTALVYREYLDPDYLIPKPDKIVAADVNEPAFNRRVPGTVIYARPDDRLLIHVFNADSTPHSLHMHGLRFGIDSDGSWPLGTQSSDGRRSDEICPGQTWTYRFDVTDDMLGAWPFHDHSVALGPSIDRGLFGGVVVLPRRLRPPRGLELPPLVKDFLGEIAKQRPRRPPVPDPAPFHVGAHALAPPGGHLEAGRIRGPLGMAELAGALPRAPVDAPAPRPTATVRVGKFDVRSDDVVHFLEEWALLHYAHRHPRPRDVLHVPLFFHFMARSQGKPAFDSGSFMPGAPPFEVTFGAEGIFAYHCQRHPSMRATVVVAAGEAASKDVSIVDGAMPFAFDPPEVRVRPGGMVRWHAGTVEHTVTEDGAGLPSWCFNGRTFVGNTPTIEAEAGQRIRWYVFNLDLGMNWHNFHLHGQRWNFAGQEVDIRSIGPAESFVVETTAPPVLTLPHAIQKQQEAARKPRHLHEYHVRGDFLVHCHVEMHMAQGLAAVVRSRQALWLTHAQAEELRATTGLPLDDGQNTCPDIDLDRCLKLGCGSWQDVPGLPEVTFMHALLLPGTEKVLYWGYGDLRDDLSRIWDYSTPTGTYSPPANQPFDVTVPAHDRPLANIWSAEHAYLDDPAGTLLVHGGFTPRQSFLFDPTSRAWSLTGATAQDRFYSTTLTLADGKAMTMYGSASRSLEIYDAGTWSAPKPLPSSFDYVYYPWAFLLPGGEIFVAGHQGVTHRFDPAATPILDDPAQTWTTIAGERSTGGENGTAVLLPLRPPGYEPRVLIAAGDPAPAQQTSEWIDLSAPSPAWTALPNLNQPRPRQVNSVLLPDGRVFLAGGIDGVGGPAEIFDPQNPSAGWLVCSSMKYPRGYHSAAILLADGSVLMGGDRPGAWRSGETTPNERYYPSYYFMARPAVAGAPADVTYGSTFTVDTPDAAAIGEVALLRPGSVTHGWNMSQRHVECTISGRTASTLDVVAPPDGTIAPPGYYLLFLVSAGRIPSVARWIRVHA